MRKFLFALFILALPSQAFAQATPQPLNAMPNAGAVSTTDTFWLCQTAVGCGPSDGFFSATMTQLKTFMNSQIGITWPPTNSVVVSAGVSNNTPTGLAPVNGDCIFGSGGVWTVTPCAGATLTLPISVGSGGIGLSSGTSGGILGFTGATTLASSAALSANNPVIGGGAGATPSSGTRSGNTTTFGTTTGTLTSGHCVSIDANGNLQDAGAACGGGSGSVTSVAFSVPASSIFGVTGTPITTSGTLGLTTTGTSTGIPYFSSGTALSSSGALTSGNPILAGSPPTTGTLTGNTTKLATVNGSLTNGHCVTIDANSNMVDSGGACGGSGGTGTVTSVGLTVPASSILSISGSPVTTSGNIALATAGTSGGIPYFSSASALSSSAALTANLPVIGGGAGAAPTVGTVSGNTTKFLTTTGTLTNGHCASFDVNLNLIDSGGACGSGGSGTVTSVGLSAPGGGVFGVTGSPVAVSGTLGLTAAGTSGGIPYFASASTISSSAALTANAPVIGGGAGAAPTVGTRSGNTTVFGTTSGSLTSGDCIKADANGNLVDAGGACSTGGSVTSGTAGQLAYYGSTGTTVSGNANLTISSGVLTAGIAGSILGTYNLAGNTSGTISIKPQAAAGTYNFNLPIGAGLANQPLLSGGGGTAAMTYGTLSGNTTKFVTTTGSLPSGDLASYDASGNAVDSALAATNVALLNANQTLTGNNTFSGNNVHSGTETFTGTVIGSHSNQTAAFNIDSTMCGKTIHYNSASAANGTVQNTLPADCNIPVEALGTGLLTIVPGAGATAHSACVTQRTRIQYSIIWIHAESTGVYNVSGDCG